MSRNYSDTVSGKLLAWLEKQPSEAFPKGFDASDYRDRVRSVRRGLERKVYPEVGSGAIVAEVQEEDQLIYLTDHGEEHVDTVLDRASDLLEETQCRMRPYECFMFLVAVLFHDVGNIYGRDKHEEKLGEIVKEFTNADWDRFEVQRIIDIAQAHGGKNSGGSYIDTIGKLEVQTPVLNVNVRPRFLAALLRLSDELAEGQERAARFLVADRDDQVKAEDVIGDSLQYHHYSDSLFGVQIGPNEIELRFHVKESRALREYSDSAPSRFLLDEIFRRTKKSHAERVYCMQYMPQQIAIDYIYVDIRVYDDEYSDEVHPPIQYRLERQGYPGHELEKSISELCPTLGITSGGELKSSLLS